MLCVWLLKSDSWIGYNDITIEGTFTWDFTGDSGTYTNWNFLGGEPSNDPPGEDCVTMYENVPGPGTWNDDKCESSLRDYICERGGYSVEMWNGFNESENFTP